MASVTVVVDCLPHQWAQAVLWSGVGTGRGRNTCCVHVWVQRSCGEREHWGLKPLALRVLTGQAWSPKPLPNREAVPGHKASLRGPAGSLSFPTVSPRLWSPRHLTLHLISGEAQGPREHRTHGNEFGPTLRKTVLIEEELVLLGVCT